MIRYIKYLIHNLQDRFIKKFNIMSTRFHQVVNANNIYAFMRIQGLQIGPLKDMNIFVVHLRHRLRDRFSRAVSELNMLLLILIITGLSPVAAQQENNLGNA